MIQINPYIKAEITQSGIKVEGSGTGHDMIHMISAICESESEELFNRGADIEHVMGVIRNGCTDGVLTAFSRVKGIPWVNMDGGSL